MEFGFNLPIVQSVMVGLIAMGVTADMDLYARGGGNTARWSGTSRLLVEFHCNAFNGTASGTETLYALGSGKGAKAAQAVQDALVEELGLPNRALKPVLPEGRGGYLLHGVMQPAIIPEPFFIDNDNDLARGQGCNLASAYVNGILAALSEV